MDELEENQPEQDTQRYLAHIENKLYADIQTRKRIDSGLLFLACQLSSCSLAWLLFQAQVTLAVIQVSAICIALLPGLIDVGDGFKFSISSDGWEFSLGDKPLSGIIKLLIGITVSHCGTYQITTQVMQTETAIAQTYEDIRVDKGLGGWQFRGLGAGLLIAAAAIALIGLKASRGSQHHDKG